MKEYTILSVISVFIVCGIDYLSGIRLLKRSSFYIFLLIIFIMKFLVNGFLTYTEIVQYNPRFFLDIRLTSIPIEDFFFGFSMVTLTIVLWEYFKKK